MKVLRKFYTLRLSTLCLFVMHLILQEVLQIRRKREIDINPSKSLNITLIKKLKGENENTFIRMLVKAGAWAIWSGHFHIRNPCVIISNCGTTLYIVYTVT